MRKIERFRVLFLAILFALAVLGGCGILPKINQDPNSRTKNAYTESTPSADPESAEGIAHSDETPSDEVPAGFFEDERQNRINLQNTLLRFYEEAYEQYLNLQDIDLSDVLDLSYEECQNIQQELQQAVEERRAAVKAGTAKKPEKLPYELIISGGASTMGSEGDDIRRGDFFYIVKPLAEQGDLSDEAYLKQYPPFLKFGLNLTWLYKYKTDGKWSDYKINTFYYVFWTTTHNTFGSFERTVRAFYDEAWIQYEALKYTGLQTVMDETSADYQEAEALLKTSIDAKKAQNGDTSAEGLDYMIKIIDITLDPPGFSWDRLGTVHFELIPDPELREGETLEEKLKEYPAFMEFGEHCWSIHMTQKEILKEEGRADKHLVNFTVEEFHASEAPDAVKYNPEEEGSH